MNVKQLNEDAEFALRWAKICKEETGDKFGAGEQIGRLATAWLAAFGPGVEGAPKDNCEGYFLVAGEDRPYCGRFAVSRSAYRDKPYYDLAILKSASGCRTYGTTDCSFIIRHWPLPQPEAS